MTPSSTLFILFLIVKTSSPVMDPNDGDSDVWSVKSGSTGFAPSMASSATTVDWEVDWEVDSASRPPSVFSMTSSLLAEAYRHEFGRELNNYSDVYRLPADEEELLRLDKQHLMFMEVMGKYPPPMAEVLADDTPGETKACVDLGCGSGKWILDVAYDFPHVSTVAVDLVPLQVLIPANCRSEVDDINLGLHHFHGEFNVVHARLISSGIRDYEGLIDHIAATTREGGLIDLTEFDFRVYGSDREPVRIDKKASAIAKWMDLVCHAVKQQGGEPDAAHHLHEWISKHGSFEKIVDRRWWFQTSPWNTGQDPVSQRLNHHGSLMRDDILAFLKSGRPLLLGTGIPEHVLDFYEDTAKRELQESIVPGYILVENVYARKRTPRF